VSKAQAARARQAFNFMLEERDAAKRAARPGVPSGECVPVCVIVFQPLGRMAEAERQAHAAADARIDVAAFDRYLAASRAELDAILADGDFPNLGNVSGLPTLEEVSGLIQPDSELLAHGF